MTAHDSRPPSARYPAAHHPSARRAARAAGVGLGAGALLLTAAGPALASVAPPTHGASGAMTADAMSWSRAAWYEHSGAEWTALTQARLDAFEAKAESARALLLKVPADTLLTARQAVWAKAAKTHVSRLGTALDAMAARVPGGLTPAQAAQVASIKADLEAISDHIAAILDNGIKPTTVRTPTRSVALPASYLAAVRAKVAATRDGRDGRCDHEGAFAGSRDSWWSGWDRDRRDGDRRDGRHHRGGDRR